MPWVSLTWLYIRVFVFLIINGVCGSVVSVARAGRVYREFREGLDQRERENEREQNEAEVEFCGQYRDLWSIIMDFRRNSLDH